VYISAPKLKEAIVAHFIDVCRRVLSIAQRHIGIRDKAIVSAKAPLNNTLKAIYGEV
jgi:hypothetical protein